MEKKKTVKKKVKKPKRPKKKKKPKFNVLNAGFRKKVKHRWRKPRGTHNKKRMKMEFAGAHPTVGYRNPVDVRGLRPDGFMEVLVHTPGELDGLKDIAVRISSKVGKRKRQKIIIKAGSLGLKVVNLRKKEGGSK